MLFQSRFPAQKFAWGNCTLVRNHEFSTMKVEHSTWAKSSMVAALISHGGDDALILIMSIRMPSQFRAFLVSNSLLLDEVYGYKNKENLWSNLAE